MNQSDNFDIFWLTDNPKKKEKKEEEQTIEEKMFPTAGPSVLAVAPSDFEHIFHQPSGMVSNIAPGESPPESTPAPQAPKMPLIAPKQVVHMQTVPKAPARQAAMPQMVMPPVQAAPVNPAILNPSGYYLIPIQTPQGTQYVYVSGEDLMGKFSGGMMGPGLPPPMAASPVPTIISAPTTVNKPQMVQPTPKEQIKTVIPAIKPKAPTKDTPKKTVAPQKMTDITFGTYVVDMGQNKIKFIDPWSKQPMTVKAGPITPKPKSKEDFAKLKGSKEETPPSTDSYDYAYD